MLRKKKVQYTWAFFLEVALYCLWNGRTSSVQGNSIIWFSKNAFVFLALLHWENHSSNFWAMRFCYDFLLSQTIHSVQGDGSELIHFVTTYSQTQTPLVSHGNHHDRNFSKDLPCGKALHTSQKMQTHGENCQPPCSHRPQVVMCLILNLKLGLWGSSLPTDFRMKTLDKSDWLANW